MFLGAIESNGSSFRKLSFSPTVWRCLERSKIDHNSLATCAPKAVYSLLSQMRRAVSVASNKKIEQILKVNPNVVRITKHKNNGLVSLLPLNERGFQALISGQFDGKSPDPAWICKIGERPSALYVWLVFLPGNFAKFLGAISEMFDEMASEAVPLFSRSVSRHSLHLHQTAGFLPAQDCFSEARSDLQVVFPVAAIKRSEPPVARKEIEIEVARTFEEVVQVFSVRSATYIAEQFCSYQEEFDGNDFCATHLLGKISGDAAGCIRLRFFSDFVKLERLAVRLEYRQSRLAFELVRAALRHCQRKGYTRIIGHSRLDLVRFWRVFGFREMKERQPFSFANVKYVELMLEMPQAQNSIKFDEAPLIMIRPEGAWDRPGAFERPTTPDDASRKSLLAQHTRTMKNQTITA